MKGFGEKNQSKKEKISKNKQKVNISQLINKAFELQAQGKKYIRKRVSCINTYLSYKSNQYEQRRIHFGV